MPLSPFLPRSVRQDDPYGGPPRVPPNTPIRPQLSPGDTPRSPRGTLRPAPLYVLAPHDPKPNTQIPRPQPPILRSTSPYYHQHTSSSPELRPRVDNAWAPRVRPYPQQPSDLSQTGNVLSPSHTSHIIQRPRGDLVDATQKRSGFAARVNSYFVPGIRGRSASDVRMAHTPPPDLDPDRLARACGQPAPESVYPHDDRRSQGISIDSRPSRPGDLGAAPNAEASLSHSPLPKIRVGDMYRRLDALARRSGHRAMDYLGIEDVVIIHKRDNQLREQLRRKRSERLQEKDPDFHAIGTPLDEVLLYASAAIVVGDYQYYLPIVAVACVEELTKIGIYQSGLFRELPSRERHLQLIDLFDKSPDFGAHFNMRGQTMPDICALLSTFISSLPAPLFDTQIYAAFWHWSVKPSVKREDVRRDQQEEEEEERRARGEPPQPIPWTMHTDIYIEDADNELETDQISIAQILLRFLPSANLSLLAYLCGFFTQLPLCPENGLQLEDMARIFGHRLLGGSVKAVSQRMMLWLLTRWHRIYETLFGDMCGMAPPPSEAPYPQRSGLVDAGNNEQSEKGNGKRESGSDHELRHTTSSSSSHSSPSPQSPGDRGPSSRKSSSDGEDEGGCPRGCRRRKKREFDVKAPRSNAQGVRPPSVRKESRHGRRVSGSRRHHFGHSPEQMNTPTSPDPFAMAFAKAQQDLADAPLLTFPSGAAGSGDLPRESRSQLETTNHRRLDIAVTTDRVEDDLGLVDIDIHALLRETVVATDVAKSLAKRVEVLERALHVHAGEDHGIVEYPDNKDEGGAKHGKEDDMEDELRLQLRQVEAERDEAQRIVRDVRAYLLDEGPILQ